MNDLLHFTFFRNALFISIMLSLLYSTLSFFVVLRNMTFLGAGIAHAAFGGVAIGIVLGLPPVYTALVFCVATALIIGRLAQKRVLSYDMGIGIFFAFSMALGAFLIFVKKAYTFDLSGYLFGNILAVKGEDLIVTAVMLVLCAGFIGLFLHRLLFMAFDETNAALSGVPVGVLNGLLMFFLAAVIVLSIKIVGIVLVSALIVLPASFGRLWSHDFRRVLAAGLVYTLCVMVGGLFLSYVINTPSGATIVILGTIVYFAGMGLRAGVGKGARSQAAGATRFNDI